MRKLANIVNLGIKELWSIRRDPAMIVLIGWTFTVSIHSAATGVPDTLHKAPIAVVDEDYSPLSQQLRNAFQLPYFMPAVLIDHAEMDRGLDTGDYTFTLNIPPGFQRDVLAGRQPAIQLNVDATKMSDAFTGSGYIQTIIATELSQFVGRYRDVPPQPVELALRVRFNPNLTQAWFTSVIELINNITMLSILVTGAAVLREREHGTLEHLLVMPLTAFEIMVSKVWSMGLVVLAATTFSLLAVVQGWLSVPVAGSRGLFLLGATLHLFATTSMGIYLGTVARSMPQFGLLCILILLPLQILSGGSTPRESMPTFVQNVMLLAPTTHFVGFAKAILFRGAGLAIVWPQFVAILVIGIVFFLGALSRFRRAITQSA